MRVECVVCVCVHCLAQTWRIESTGPLSCARSCVCARHYYMKLNDLLSSVLVCAHPNCMCALWCGALVGGGEGERQFIDPNRFEV